MHHFKALPLFVTLLFLAASCSENAASGPAKEGEACEKSSDCADLLICQDGTCQKAAASPKDEPKDSSSDAKSDEACKGDDCNTDGPSTDLKNCGNGQLDEGEVCDDGARIGGDGCSANCQVESHWVCDSSDKTKPSICECAAGFDPDKNCTDCLTNHFGARCDPCTVIGGKICSNHGFCNDGIKGNGKCTCASSWTGEICNKSNCPAGYDPKEKCQKCLPGFDPNKDCNDCLPTFYGENCDGRCPGLITAGVMEVPCNAMGICNDGKGPKEGLGTCECNAGVTGADCSGCDGNHTNPANDCRDCIEGFVGADCDLECPGHASGATCGGRGTCKVNGDQAVCDNCAGNFTGENCSECAYGWEGQDCNTCGSHWQGAECNECAYGWTGSTCNTCGSHWKGTACNECAYGWTGSTCNTCGSHWKGTACNECANDYFGENCQNKCTCVNGTCNSGKSGDGKCLSCNNPRWQGENCTICNGGYGMNCSAYSTVSDGTNSYKTIIINGREWMAENYRKQVVKSGNTYEKYTWPNLQQNLVGTYGRLYAWSDAIVACPSGWRLPTRAELNELTAYVKDANNRQSDTAFLALIAKSGWKDQNGDAITGGDDFGFKALPAGAAGPNVAGGAGSFGIRFAMWSCSKWNKETYYATLFELSTYYDEPRFSGAGTSSIYYSARCIRRAKGEDATNNCPEN